MFNNIALDVVTGLVLIYLLYSLFMTILGEYISTKLGIRGRMLRIAIERMLNDGYYQKLDDEKPESKNKRSWAGSFLKWLWRALQTAVLYEPEEFKTSFAGRFYDYPSIKYLSRVEDKNSWFALHKPSYFSAENFAETMVNLFRDKGEGQTDEGKINFCLTFNTYPIEPETLSHILNLWENSKQNIPEFKIALIKWFDETMDRTNGWYKRKIQFILLVAGFIVAASFNADTIKITKILASDKKAREQLVDMGVQLSKDSTRHKGFTGSVADSIRAKSLDSAYTHITKDIQSANLILGLGWDFSSLQEEKELEIKDKGKSAFTGIAGQKKAFDQLTKQKGALQFRVKKNNHLLTEAKNALHGHQLDSLIIRNEKGLTQGVSAKKQIQGRDSTNRKDIANAKLLILKLGKDLYSDSVYLAGIRDALRSIKDSVNQLTGEKFNIIDSIALKKSDLVIVKGKVPYGFLDKVGYFFACIFHNFLGLLITAIALSLGAPFWFGILGKLASIRTAGVKPEEKPEQPVKKIANPDQKQPVAPLPADVAVKGKDIVEEALIIYGPKIRAIPGVKSVFIFKDPKAQRKLRINVADALTENEVTQQFKGKITIGTTPVDPEIIVTGAPATHHGPGVIHNRSGLENSGSIGLVLKREDTNSFHILSCWHVLKDLNSKVSSPIIEDHKHEDLASRWAGGIEGAFDYGLARCLANASIKSNNFLNVLNPDGKFSVRAVTQLDIENQIAINFLDFLQDPPAPVNGILLTDATEVEIGYADKTRIVKDVLVLTQSGATQKTISRPGNSGAAVFDGKNKVIGMIIGGDLHFTYAVRVSGIMNIHKELSVA